MVRISGSHSEDPRSILGHGEFLVFLNSNKINIFIIEEYITFKKNIK